MKFIEKYDAFIFDLDGTIYRGETLIPGAKNVINELIQKGKKILFVSNKTTGTVQDYFQFLQSNGMEIELYQIINSTTVLIEYLTKNFPKVHFYAIGEKSFINELKNANFIYSKNIEKIEVVIVTLDRTFNFNKLEIAAHAIEKGARFFAANIDDTCPVEGGEIIDADSTISALEKRTHKKLEEHFGKPSEFMIMAIKSRLQKPNEKCLMIGDRLETDIVLGAKAGFDTALVSTGVFNFQNGSSELKPTYYLKSVNDLLNSEI